MLGRKSQGLSIGVIIIAAISLIVLVVLVAVFTGRMSNFGKAIETCQGVCLPEKDCLAKTEDGGCSDFSIEEVGSEYNKAKISNERLVCCLLKK